MCLYTKKNKLIADHDIKCYKILQTLQALKNEVGRNELNKWRERGFEYLTPYNYFPMKIDTTYTDDNRPCVESADDLGIKDVSRGFFHTFSHIEHALDTIGDCGMYGAIVVECVIPKGTEYYEGSMVYEAAVSGTLSSYASKTLKLTHIIVAKTDNPTDKPNELDCLTLKYNGKVYEDFGYDKDHFANYWVEVEK